MSKHVDLDQDECIGCQSCVELCPEVFDFVEEIGKAYVIDPEWDDIDCIEEAADSCPVDCITFET